MSKRNSDLLTLILILTTVAAGLLATWIHTGHAQTYSKLTTSWDGIGRNATADALACAVLPFTQPGTPITCRVVPATIAGRDAAECTSKFVFTSVPQIYHAEGSYSGDEWRGPLVDFTSWTLVGQAIYYRSDALKRYIYHFATGGGAVCTIERQSSGQLTATFAGSL